MTKVQEYLSDKKGLPKMYVVKSTREGVEAPIERKVIEIRESVSIRLNGDERIPIDEYRFDVSPYSVQILRGKTSGKNDGYGSGFGDLWHWSYFSSFSLEEAEAYYIEELERVENKYLKFNIKQRFKKGDYNYDKWEAIVDKVGVLEQEKRDWLINYMQHLEGDGNISTDLINFSKWC